MLKSDEYNAPEYMNLLKNISYLRKKHRLTKKEMARRLGIGVGSLAKLEKGIVPPRLSALIILFAYQEFGVWITEPLEEADYKG